MYIYTENLAPLEISKTEYSYGKTNVTIELLWTQESNVMYNVSTVPDLVIGVVVDSSVNLTAIVPYNTMYNVSIMATTCGQNSVTTIVTLYYGEFCR